MFFIYNQQSYGSENYGTEDVVIKTTESFWLDFDANYPFQQTYTVAENLIESEEQFFNPGWFNPTDHRFFSLTKGGRRPIIDSDSVGGLHIEMDIDQTIYKRSIYNALDFLGDVGGLKEALNQIGQLIFFLCS